MKYTLVKKKKIKRTVFVQSRDKQWEKTQISGLWQGDFWQACRSALFGTACSKAKHRKTLISKLNLRNLDSLCNFGYSKCKIYIYSSVTMRVLNTYNPTYEYELMTDLEIHSNQTQSQKKKGEWIIYPPKVKRESIMQTDVQCISKPIP